MFHITLLSWGKKKRVEQEEEEEEEEEETWDFFSSEAFNWECMEAAAVENEDLLCGLRSPHSSSAWR